MAKGLEKNKSTFNRWKKIVDQSFISGFCIDLVDIGLDDAELKIHWQQRTTPEDFVLWFANKYDLLPASKYASL